MYKLAYIKELFNNDVLTLQNAIRYSEQGINIICEAGRVNRVVTVEDEAWESYCREA